MREELKLCNSASGGSRSPRDRANWCLGGGTGQLRVNCNTVPTEEAKGCLSPGHGANVMRALSQDWDSRAQGLQVLCLT